MREPEAPLVFWRERAGRREGLACQVTFCSVAGCECHSAQIDGYQVGERLLQRTPRAKPAPPAVSVLVDIETGQVEPAGAGASASAPLVKWLRQALDAEALADLRARRARHQQTLLDDAEAEVAKTWRDHDWSGWNERTPVPWSMVAGGVEPDEYTVDREAFVAVDLYCIDPECTCRDISVDFELLEGEKLDVLGTVFVDADSGEVVGTSNKPGKRRALERLWAAFEKRRPPALLQQRWQQMREIGPQICKLLAQARTVTRDQDVGRNDPCPCGSGKKYKKCCLGRD
jgi:hypothetical protein